MLQIRVKILYNRKIKGNYFHLVLQAAKITKESLPGQFLHIKVNDAYEPLLRRPFSIHRLIGVNVEVLYEVVGRATQILSHRKSGEYLDVIGPLGNGFNYQLPIILRQAQDISAKDTEQRRSASYRLPILVAGGMGVVPLVFLAQKLMEIKNQKSKIKNIVLIGAKTKNQILCEKEFQKSGFQVRVTTDDGSKGFKGKVTDLLKALLSTINYKLSTIYACGPRPMLEEISRISKKYNISAQVSLEEHMACGFGACLGCAVSTKDGFKRVCKEGPVFKSDEIVW